MCAPNRWPLSLTFILLLVGMLGAAPVLATPPPNNRHIAVVVNDLGNTYFQTLASSVRNTAREIIGADAQVTVVSSGYDVTRQRQQLQQILASDAGLVVLTAAQPDALRDSVQALRDAGRMVVAVDVAALGAHLTITTDNYDAGYQSCQHLAAALGGAGDIAILDGPPVSSIVERLSGCQAALAEFPGVQIIDRENSGASYVGGLEAMSRLLTRHPSLAGVFSINDPASLGAEAAAAYQQRPVLIASVDGSPAVVEALARGDGLLLNTAAQFPQEIGERAVRIGLQTLEDGVRDIGTMLIPVELITADNVTSYCVWSRC
ncbi:MAG: substrate-binding domain-containing protein [Natronospirillum sp.]